MAYQLLLLEDIDELGKSGDVVKVKPGYARNCLLPSKKAVVADERTVQLQKKLQEEREKLAVIQRSESEQIAGKLAGLTLTLPVKVDSEGHLYGSVTSADIAAHLEAQGIVIEKRQVVLPQSIKSLGLHNVTIKLKEGIKGLLQLEVVREDQVFG